MSGEPISIDWLVAEVVRRLEQLAATTPAPPPPVASPPVRAADAAHELVVDARVVTLATIEGRLGQVQRLLVPRGAVVTPSVKDELRKRHVRLEWLQEPAASTPAADELTVVRCTRTPQAARAASQLPRPAGANIMMCDELASAAQNLATVVTDPHRLALLLTDEPLAAVCLANRFSAVRAAQVRDVPELRDAIAAIGLNLLVVNPATTAVETWNELLTVFRQELPRRSPPRLLAQPGRP